MDIGELCGHFRYQTVFSRYRFNQIRQSQIIPAACFLADHITRLFLRVHWRSGGINLDTTWRAAAGHAGHHEPALIHQLIIKTQRHPKTSAFSRKGERFREQGDFQLICFCRGTAVISQRQLCQALLQRTGNIFSFSADAESGSIFRFNNLICHF